MHLKGLGKALVVRCVHPAAHPPNDTRICGHRAGILVGAGLMPPRPQVGGIGLQLRKVGVTGMDEMHLHQAVTCSMR